MDYAIGNSDAISQITLALFSDSRSFGNFECLDDASPCDDDTEDHSVGARVDLVDAGVFKRTLGILKEQPRCVLCSVAFKPGDRISVSNSPECCHQYHEQCITRWLKTKSNKCPVCRTHYTMRPVPSQ